MVNNGWICLHRKIRDNWIWEDPEKLKAWIDILMMVNHEEKKIPFNGKMITIKKGQKLTSIVQLAERWGWSRHRVYRFIALLKADNMCTTDGTANGTLITVVNWEFYQDGRASNGTTDGSANDTPNGTPGGTQTTMNNNYKQYNKSRSRAKSDAAWEGFVAEMKRRGEWVDDNNGV